MSDTVARVAWTAEAGATIARAGARLRAALGHPARDADAHQRHHVVAEVLPVPGEDAAQARAAAGGEEHVLALEEPRGVAGRRERALDVGAADAAVGDDVVV